jgi:hypothetical protein
LCSGTSLQAEVSMYVSVGRGARGGFLCRLLHRAGASCRPK